MITFYDSRLRNEGSISLSELNERISILEKNKDRYDSIINDLDETIRSQDYQNVEVIQLRNSKKV